jgi:hypothetical protein
LPQTVTRFAWPPEAARASKRWIDAPTFGYQLDAFIDAIENGRPLLTGVDDAVKQMRVIDRCYISAGLPLRATRTSIVDRRSRRAHPDDHVGAGVDHDRHCARRAPRTTQRFDLLVLDRAEPRWWPWLTAHVLHTDAEHMGWNVSRNVPRVVGRNAGPVALLDIDRGGRGRGRPLVRVVQRRAALLLRTVRRAEHRPPHHALCIARYDRAAMVVRLGRTGGGQTRMGMAQRDRAVDTYAMATAVGAHVAGFGAGMVLVAVYARHDRVRL